MDDSSTSMFMLLLRLQPLPDCAPNPVGLRDTLVMSVLGNEFVDGRVEA
jgi:hypothetical protein